MKRQVKQLIHQKGLQHFAVVSPAVSVAEALHELTTTNSSAILVVKDSRLKGIFSEKDFAKASLKFGDVLSAKVDSIMTTEIYYAEPTFTLEECLQIMSRVHVRHLPVMDRETPVALLSMRHIMEALVDEKENQIRELTSYITGPSAILDLDQNKKNSGKILIYPSRQNREAL